LGKTRKKATPQFEILITGEFYGSVDSWTEYLCLARNADGSITLNSRSREILAEAGKYRERGWLPATIRRKEVEGYDGDYVVGKRLLLHDAEAEITVRQNQFDVAAAWLISRKWNLQDQIGRAWARIRSALYAPGLFGAETPLPLLNSATDHPWRENRGVADTDDRDGKEPSESGGHKPREIVIRAAGPSKPFIVWVELVFIERSKTSYSVYARTGDAVGGVIAQSPGLTPRTSGWLRWRSVLDFVRSHDLADVSGVPLQEVAISGVQPWQRDVITAVMLRLSAIVPFLSRLSDKELKSLHERLGGFLSEESPRLLNPLAAATRPLGRRSLANIAQLVGSPDPMDAGGLAEDCAAYLADRHAERLLAQYRDAPAPPKAFLSLLDRHRPRSVQIRAGLFDLWLRAEPKPTGGDISGMLMEGELPVLHWLLREQVAEIFRILAENHHDQLRDFVCWFLDKARPYTEYFSGNYRFTSFNMYAFGRPRFAAWIRLAQEVQDAAVNLQMTIPEATRAVLIGSPVRVPSRRLKRIQDAFFGGGAEGTDQES
jgi:hypothetical protein